MLSVIIFGGTFWGCNANNSENFEYKELIINNQNCDPAYFDFSNQYMRVSLVDILSEIGFNIEWVNKEKATLQFNDSIYTLDISEKTYADVKKTMTLNVKGHEAEIRVLRGPKGYCNSADADVRLTNGHIRVEIITNDNMDIEGYWQNDPISDSSYMAIFEDILSIILGE